MTETKHIINVLTFSHPVKEKTFGFKRQKQSGHSPLRRGEFPKELWATHQHELSDLKHLYCDFTTSENVDYTTSVDLTKSIRFAKHYYHFRIAQYFKQVAHVVHPNFVNAATIWFEAPGESTYQYTLYYKFTLSVRLAIMTDKPELIVSFDGTSKVLKKNILQLVSEDIGTGNLNGLVRKGELIYYDELTAEDNNDLDEFYPVLNPDLADALKLAPEPRPRNDDRYANYFKNINGLLAKYLIQKNLNR